MKIVFVSNYLSPHQLPFCLAMSKQPSVEFTFIATLPVSDARKELGYDDLDKKYPFVLCAYESKELEDQGKLLVEKADVVLVGTVSSKKILRQIRKAKIVCKLSERQLKSGLEPHKYLFRYMRWHLTRPKTEECYLLCASAYAAYDFSLFGMYKDKAYKWGYFPETKHYPDIDSLISAKDEHTILWVGRLLDWKQPEYMLKLAAALKSKGCKFHINIVGTGPLEDDLKKNISEQKLENEISFLGSKKVAEVRNYMEKSEIFITTSNQREGWGAVVNEAMNSGCAVVANSIVGSAPYLIKHKINGMIYACNNIDSCVAAVEELLGNRALCHQMGKEAYKTITKFWNANAAAERFVTLCENLTQGRPIDGLFEDGICSKAPILKNDWSPEGGKV